VATVGEPDVKIRQTICPRYWGRWWRYRWLVHAGRYGLVGHGYAWTRRGAKQAAGYLADEVMCVIEVGRG
jgi:hypothetical protein